MRTSKKTRMALEAILHAVPVDMMPKLAIKASAKEAWELGRDKGDGRQWRLCPEGRGAAAEGVQVDLVLRQETIDDFALRLSVAPLTLISSPYRLLARSEKRSSQK